MLRIIKSDTEHKATGVIKEVFKAKPQESFE